MSAVPWIKLRSRLRIDRSILLCDLDDDVRSRLASTLLDLGHRVILCATLTEALSLLDGIEVVFLSDRVIGNGLSAFRERSDSLPLIFLLSEPDEQRIFQAYQDGADMVLVRPVLAEHLGFLSRLPL